MQVLFEEQNIPLNKVITIYQIDPSTLKIINVLILDPYKKEELQVGKIKEILSVNPKIRIIVITSISNKHIVDDVIALGVNAVLFKCCKTAEFINAYYKAIKGECHYCSSIYDTKKKTETTRIEELTEREQEVVDLIIEGKF